MKYYLISGGGKGIGRSIAQKLAEDKDHSVAVCGRDLSSLKETLLSLDHKENHYLFSLDVTSEESIETAAKDFHFPHLDGLIANAGLGGENHFGRDDRWNEIVSTNLTGTYMFVNAFLPWLKKNSDAYKHIVILSSILARLGVPGYTAYCASKAGLLGLMRSWANEFASQKILVNAICPGWVNTKMADEGMNAAAVRMKITKDEFYKMAMSAVPLRKMSEPSEIARLVHFLVNQQSITGAAIDVNNGAVMNS